MSLLVTTAPPAPPGSSRTHGETVKRTDMTFASMNSNFRSDPVPPDTRPNRRLGSFTLRSAFRFVTSVCVITPKGSTLRLATPLHFDTALVLSWLKILNAYRRDAPSSFSKRIFVVVNQG
jgi:hypothetical protein